MIIRSVSFAFERRRITDDDSRGILTLDDRQDTRTPRVYRDWPDHPHRRVDDLLDAQRPPLHTTPR